jgi:ribA/ribD-fused uncharacterized protein
MIASVEDLKTVMVAGDRVKFLFFWGHRPSPDGRITASCLSQWWPASFEVAGHLFRSAEHYMMWRKALLFGDGASATRILTAAHPAQAKDMGRRVRGFDEDVWARERFGIVVAASVAKFGQHPNLGGFLLGTTGRVLVEASPHDRVWGIGLAADDARAGDPQRWLGLNLLGFALMQARAILTER